MSEHKDGGEQRAEEAVTPAVSIIIPTYNTADYIRETLESVFAQTFQDYEIIVVNDGSPDTEELERVLAPYRGRIAYIKQENRGPSAARNAAIRAARAPLIAFLDSDDIWEPNYLAVQVAEMQRDTTIDVLYPNASTFGHSVTAGRTFMDSCPSNGEVTFESLLTLECNVLVLATARREAVVRAGMFDEAMRSSEDFDLWLRIVGQGGRIAYHRQVLARRRLRNNGLSADPVWMRKHILKVLDKSARTMDLTAGQRATLERQRANFYAMLRLFEGKRAFFQGDAETAREAMKEANTFLKSRKLTALLVALKFAPRLLLRIYDARDRFVLKINTKF